MGQRAMGRDITWSDMMFSLSVSIKSINKHFWGNSIIYEAQFHELWQNSSDVYDECLESSNKPAHYQMTLKPSLTSVSITDVLVYLGDMMCFTVLENTKAHPYPVCIHLEHMEILHFSASLLVCRLWHQPSCWNAWCVSLWGWGVEELRKLPPCPLFLAMVSLMVTRWDGSPQDGESLDLLSPWMVKRP